MVTVRGNNLDAITHVKFYDSRNLVSAHIVGQKCHKLVFEVPVEELERAKRIIKAVMEGVADLDVPIKVELKVGKNWYEAEPL